VRRLGVAVAILCGCGGSTSPKPAPTTDQRILAAADSTLECLGSAGATCMRDSAAADAWLAQIELEKIATTPAPLVPDAMLRAADTVRDTRVTDRIVGEETERAVPLARDLSCRARRVVDIGAE
jgi:hypothetical protein